MYRATHKKRKGERVIVLVLSAYWRPLPLIPSLHHKTNGTGSPLCEILSICNNETGNTIYITPCPSTKHPLNTTSRNGTSITQNVLVRDDLCTRQMQEKSRQAGRHHKSKPHMDEITNKLQSFFFFNYLLELKGAPTFKRFYLCTVTRQFNEQEWCIRGIKSSRESK